jgi:hypothetical protein
MDELQWQDNSKQMYEAILKEIPGIFRGSVKKNIAKWISQNKIHTVTENTIFQAVDEIAPADIASKIKTGLEKLKTKN